MRPIDADQLEHDLEYYNVPGVGDAIRHWIQVQPTAHFMDREWIPCEVRMPENDVCVLVSFEAYNPWENDIEDIVSFGVYDEEKEWWIDGRYITEPKVKAWMPLPEPYKESTYD